MHTRTDTVTALWGWPGLHGTGPDPIYWVQNSKPGSGSPINNLSTKVISTLQSSFVNDPTSFPFSPVLQYLRVTAVRKYRDEFLIPRRIMSCSSSTVYPSPPCRFACYVFSGNVSTILGVLVGTERRAMFQLFALRSSLSLSGPTSRLYWTGTSATYHCARIFFLFVFYPHWLMGLVR